MREEPRLLMHLVLANSNRNTRLASPAMWNFAVVEIGKRQHPWKQERT